MYDPYGLGYFNNNTHASPYASPYASPHASPYVPLHTPLTPSGRTIMPDGPNKRHPLRPYRWHSKLGQWKHVAERNNQSTAVADVAFRLVSWNIQFNTPHPGERLEAILGYLQRKSIPYSNNKKDTDIHRPEPTVILFQEFHRDAFPVLLANEWVKNNFYVMPPDGRKWPASKQNGGQVPYGTVTLVDKTTRIAGASLVEYWASNMMRMALLVDIELQDNLVVRIVNTHLESLESEEERRRQMKVCAKLVHENRSGGIIAGDLNAIAPSDRHLPHECGLTDACEEDSPEYHTWGYHESPDNTKPPGRLDKVLYTTDKGYVIDSYPDIIGRELKVSVNGGREKVWASDHYGLSCWVELQDEVDDDESSEEDTDGSD